MTPNHLAMGLARSGSPSKSRSCVARYTDRRIRFLGRLNSHVSVTVKEMLKYMEALVKNAK